MKTNSVTLRSQCKVLEKNKDKYLQDIRQDFPYKIPSNYLQWRFLSAALALALESVRRKDFLKETGDLACWLHSHRTALWLFKKAPMYCLSEEVIQSFDRTSVENKEDLLQSIRPALYTMLLLFPKGSVVAPGGDGVSFCTVNVSDINHPEEAMACGYGLSLPLLEHEYQLNIHFSTLTDRGDIFFTGFGLYPDGSIDYDPEAEHGRNSTSSEDELFLEKMRSLVLQTLLVLQFEPNVLHTPSTSSFTTSGKGFGVKSSISGDSFLFPRMLKIEKQRKVSSVKTGASGIHKSPKTHHRSGHWRCLHRGEEGQRFTWVRPAIINAIF